jgi:hypothetical protein
MRTIAYTIGFLLMGTELILLLAAIFFPLTTSHRDLIRAESEYRIAPSAESAAELQRQRRLIRSENIQGVSSFAACLL